MDTSTLASRARYLRDASGLPPHALSRLCGVARSYVGQVERGVIEDPRASTMRALAVACAATPEWLAYGVGSAPEPAAVRAAVLPAWTAWCAAHPDDPDARARVVPDDTGPVPVADPSDGEQGAA